MSSFSQAGLWFWNTVDTGFRTVVAGVLVVARRSRVHLHDTGETYGNHALQALWIAGCCLLAAVAALIHAAVPGVCTDTASTLAKTVAESVHDRKTKAAAPIPQGPGPVAGTKPAAGCIETFAKPDAAETKVVTAALVDAVADEPPPVSVQHETPPVADAETETGAEAPPAAPES